MLWKLLLVIPSCFLAFCWQVFWMQFLLFPPFILPPRMMRRNCKAHEKNFTYGKHFYDNKKRQVFAPLEMLIIFCVWKFEKHRKLKLQKIIKINEIAHRVGIGEEQTHTSQTLHKNVCCAEEQRNSKRSIVRDLYDEIDSRWVFREGEGKWERRRKERMEQEKPLNYVYEQDSANGERSGVTVLFVRR